MAEQKAFADAPLTADQVKAAGYTDAPLPQSAQGDSGGMLGVASISAMPAIGRGLEAFAMSPTAAATGAKVGRIVGGVAPIVGGLVEGGPVGGLVGLAAASKGSWAGGKTGWFTAKLAQNVAAPVATAIEKAAPYVETLGSMAGIQSGLDLAQMAEPKRKDIGVLGIGPSIDVPGQKPAAINALVSYLMQHGMSELDSLKAILAVKKEANR